MPAEGLKYCVCGKKAEIESSCFSCHARIEAMRTRSKGAYDQLGVLPPVDLSRPRKLFGEK